MNTEYNLQITTKETNETQYTKAVNRKGDPIVLDAEAAFYWANRIIEVANAQGQPRTTVNITRHTG